MDNMEKSFKMRDAHKRMEKSEEVIHPVTDDEMELGKHDRTLAQILQSKEEQTRFVNKFCYQKDSLLTQDIVHALADGTLLTEEQNKFLEKMRLEYNLRRAESEQVREMLTAEEVHRIGEVDPRIQEIIGKIGADEAATLLGKEFEQLAISDEKTFKKMVKQMRLVHDLRTNENMAMLNRRVDETMRRYGVSEEKYWEATRSGATADTQENLDKLVAQEYGWFKSAVNFATGGWLSHLGGAKLYKNFEDQNLALEECDKHMKAIGRILRGTLNDDVNQAIQKYMIEGGAIAEKKSDDNVETIADYKKVRNVQERFDVFRDEEAKRRNLTDIYKQPTILDQVKEDFAKREYAQQGKYKASGIIAVLLSLLFGLRTKDTIKNSLK